MPATPSRYLSVYLVDDHDIVRQGLRDLLVPARDVRVVGDSGSAQSAPDAILRLGTDVMVLDLNLQDGTGVGVCRRVRSVDPTIQGILVTSADDDDALVGAVLAGAAGFVVKLANSSDILGAIRRVGAGRLLIDSALMSRAGSILRARAQELVPALTAEELEVLDQVLAGRTDTEIADAVGQELSATQQDVGHVIDRLMTRNSVPSDLGGVTPVSAKHRRVV